MVTVKDAITTYYTIRKEHRRPIPRAISATVQERDERDMTAFLGWCREQGVDDAVGYMRERFRCISLGSRRRCVPRISQLRQDKLAKRWTGWVEGERISEASYAKRIAHDDQVALYTKALAEEPHAGKEQIKRRHVRDGTTDRCVAMIEHTGGYHPRSLSCSSCPSMSTCASQLNQYYGFDVVALRCGNMQKIPASVASAIVR